MIFYVLFILSFSLWISEDNPEPDYGILSLELQQVSSENSLSQQSIQAIEQDQYGYVWIGTREGLNRFDGYSYHHYLHSGNDEQSLSDNLILNLYIDADETLWVLTVTALHRYDRKTDQFERFTSQNDERFHLTRIHEKSNGTIFFLWNDKLMYLKPGEESLQISSIQTDFGSSKPRRIFEMFSGNWVIISHDQEMSWEIEPYMNVVPADESLQKRIASNHHIYYLLDKITEDKLDYYPRDYFAEHLGRSITTTIFVDRENHIWLKDYLQLARFNYSANKIEQVHLSSGDALRQNVTTIFPDMFGGIWIGTLNGLFYYNTNLYPFQIIRDQNSPVILASTIGPVHHNKLLSGTIGGGLKLITLDTRETLPLNSNTGSDNPQLNDVIWDIIEDRNGKIWIATDFGFNSFDAETAMLQMYGIEDRAVYTGAGNYTYTSIDIGCDDKIWLGTYTNGVKYFNEISGTVYQAVGPPEFSTTSILNILVDDNCNIWAGTSGSGLFRYDEEKDRFIPVEIRSRNSPAQIYHIRQNEQILMLATEQGVFKLSKDTGETVNLFREAGWPSQTVYAVIEDSNGDWWMSTNNGLIHYSEASGELARFTQSSGLPVREFIRSSAYKHDDGTLFFGSMDGLISFHPDDLHSDQIIPPVQLKEVRKSGKDGVEILNMMEGVPPVLDHTHHSVTFSYLAMNYTNPSQNQYRYRLYPLDNEWIDAGYSREAHYLNIPPGEYRFEVQAAVGRNLWGNTAFVDLKMMPPFWRTGWFFLLIGALLAGILYMIHYYRVTQLLKVERMRMQIAGDLHDEVGGNLSSISLMTDLINKTDDLEPLFKNRIKRVHETSRKTMEAMSDIVWAIHPDNDKLEDLILKLRDTASELLQNISYRFKVDSLLENEKIQVHFKRDFYLIFKEALHNLVKHSGATEAEISIRKKGKCIQLTIQDNGKGFNTGAVHKGYGIINMQRRSKKMDADFEITSKKDEGTTVMLLTKIT